jgi:hypothetical protein
MALNFESLHEAAHADTDAVDAVVALLAQGHDVNGKDAVGAPIDIRWLLLYQSPLVAHD